MTERHGLAAHVRCQSSSHVMLTLAKLKTYQKFGGDIDGWARATRGEDSSGMTDDDWYLIDALRQALALAKSGRASPEFGRAAEQRLAVSAADEQTREALRALVP